MPCVSKRQILPAGLRTLISAAHETQAAGDIRRAEPGVLEGHYLLAIECQQPADGRRMQLAAFQSMIIELLICTDKLGNSLDNIFMVDSLLLLARMKHKTAANFLTRIQVSIFL